MFICWRLSLFNMVGIFLSFFFFSFFYRNKPLFIQQQRNSFSKNTYFHMFGICLWGFLMLTTVFPRLNISQRFLLRCLLKLGHSALRRVSYLALSYCSWVQQRPGLRFDMSLPREEQNKRCRRIRWGNPGFVSMAITVTCSLCPFLELARHKACLSQGWMSHTGVALCQH